MTAEKALWDANKARAMNEVYWPRRAPLVLPKDMTQFYGHVAQHIGPNARLDYLEFGVAHGKSIQYMTEVFRNPDARFFGFDSFVGLPEQWLMHDVGAFSNGGRPPPIKDERIEWVPGWFQNSVPEFLEKFRPSRGRPVLVHFDADLYSSTLFLLGMLWPRLNEYFFIFDDFIYDEVIAIRDFLTAYPVNLEFYAQTKGGGDRPNPDQVFGHMTKTPFVLQGTLATPTAPV